jgi:hypothetical protein
MASAVLLNPIESPHPSPKNRTSTVPPGSWSDPPNPFPLRSCRALQRGALPREGRRLHSTDIAGCAMGCRRRFSHVWETRTRATDRGAGGRGQALRVPGSFLPRDFLRAVGLTVTARGAWIGWESGKGVKD